ncbi:hypothetical protein [Nannocystis pusilla]|uniref:hypothetical protein n=1 Tax=Nannocystis pusilla TaxID=889268 RepID=UPI003B829EFC
MLSRPGAPRQRARAHSAASAARVTAAARCFTTARRIASGVQGMPSSTSPGPNAAIAWRSAETTPRPSISGGSPTALLPWIVLSCSARSSRATLKIAGQSPIAGIL